MLLKSCDLDLLIHDLACLHRTADCIEFLGMVLENGHCISTECRKRRWSKTCDIKTPSGLYTQESLLFRRLFDESDKNIKTKERKQRKKKKNDFSLNKMVLLNRCNPCDVTRAVFLDIALDLCVHTDLDLKGNNALITDSIFLPFLQSATFFPFP